jgi:hypothetical protein
MKNLALAAVSLLAASSIAFAQSPTRVRGTITALDGDVLSVKARGGKDLTINLASDTAVAVAKSASLAELQGKYVGATAIDKGGRMMAVEVHVLPPTAAQGHTPWDLEPGSTMTNAQLESVANVTGGNEITMKYKDGEKKIVVPAGTPIVAFVPGTRADLKPGEYIFTNARQEADGKLSTNRVAVSKDGVKPPQ